MNQQISVVGVVYLTLQNNQHHSITLRRIVSLTVLLLCGAAPVQGQIAFEDVTDRSGLADLAYTWGAAWGDINTDGFPDLLVGHHYVYVESIYSPLYLNNGDGTFRAHKQFRGDIHGGVFGDVTGNRFPDLLVCRGSYHSDSLWTNVGGSLRYRTPSKTGIIDTGRGRTSSMVDVDLDGDLDIFVTNKLTPNLLWINDGSGFFTEEAAARGVVGRQDMNKAGSWCDYDKDGDMDLFVAVYDGYDHLYQNDGTGNFSDVASPAIGILMGLGSIDAYWSDFDNDLDMDLFVARSFPGGGSTVPKPHLLYINRGNGTFVESGASAGILNRQRARQCTVGDFDNDGFTDIAVSIFTEPTGILPGVDVFFHNNGDGTFKEIALNTLLLNEPVRYIQGLGSVITSADYDRDGWLDIFMTRGGHYLENRNPGPNLLLHNVTANNHSWLEIKLRGRTSNPGGIGARVLVETDTVTCLRQHFGGSHYCSQDEPLLHFGLGQATTIQRIVIKWPSTTFQVKLNPSFNQVLNVFEP